MKFRTNEMYKRDFNGSVFSQFETEYKLDEIKDEIVAVGKIDCQASIQSYEDCSLDKILDKYLDNIEDFKPNIIHVDGEYEHKPFQDLSDLGAAYEQGEQLKEMYNLKEDLSYFDTLKELEKLKLEVDNKILEFKSKSLENVVNNSNFKIKEENDNEKKDV